MTADRIALPFTEGLFLEDRQVLIPWGTPISRIEELGSPECRSTTDTIRFAWNQAKILGGLVGDVHVMQCLDPVNPRSYHLHLPEMYRFMVLVFDERTGSKRALPWLLRSVYRRLAGQIGEATFSYPDYLDGLPSIHWDLPPFAVSCSPAGWNIIAVSVDRTPEGYAGLRDEAERLREADGPGARVHFVAWDPNDPRLHKDRGSA